MLYVFVLSFIVHVVSSSVCIVIGVFVLLFQSYILFVAVMFMFGVVLSQCACISFIMYGSVFSPVSVVLHIIIHASGLFSLVFIVIVVVCVYFNLFQEADGTWGAAPWESRSLPRDFSFNYCRLISGILL